MITQHNDEDNSPAPPTRLVRVTQAAEILAISRSRCYELIARKLLPSVRLHGSVRVSVRQLEEYVRKLERDAKDEAPQCLPANREASEKEEGR
ncbi:MAG TPA: helix-turn-helix domain-containing protein [Chloroflexia bacterium]|nr:helix-turn-helix domain-containing protein [Chloroflexia bacterium]